MELVGYFKNNKVQKTTVCVYMSSDGVDQDGKHEQPIEAPETVAPSDYTSLPQVAAGPKQASIVSHLLPFPVWKTFKKKRGYK